MRGYVMFLSLFIAVSALGGSIKSPFYVFAARDAKPVSIALVKQADYVSLPITLSSDSKEPEQRYEDIRAAKRLLQEKIKETKKIILRDGPIFLSARGGASKGLFSSSSSYDQQSSATMNMMFPLDQENPDLFSATTELTKFFNGIKFADRIKGGLGMAQLVVDDPEQYRAQILRMISADLKKTAEDMGVKGHFTVNGLQNPVMVNQIDETKVELFLSYSVSLELDGGG